MDHNILSTIGQTLMDIRVGKKFQNRIPVTKEYYQMDFIKLIDYASQRK